MYEKKTNVEPATPESVWALLRELTASQAETDRRMKETDRMLSEKFAETDRFIKDVNKQIGGICNSNGEFAEEFFYNALLHKQRNIFGEHYDEVLRKNIVTANKGFEDEYDILYEHLKAY